jgi:hypothetical protein
MNDQEVLDRVRDSLAHLHMRSPVGSIISAGRSRRRVRRSLGAGMASVVVAAVAFGVAAFDEGGRPSSSNRDLRLAAFTVATNVDGTVTLTLRKEETFDPEHLRQRLEDAGVPATVRIGQHCYPENGDSPSSLDEAVRSERRDDGSVVLVITPSAIPEGSELSIGAFPGDGTTWSLEWQNAELTCQSSLPRDGDPGVAPAG